MAENASKDTSLQSTRQMLDELDALMERMLSLPVNEMEEAPAFPKETVKGPTLSASLTLLEPPTAPPPAAPPPAAPPRPAFHPVAKTEPAPLQPAPVATPLPKKPLERRPKSPKFANLPPKPSTLTKIPSRPARLDKYDSEAEISLPFTAPEPKPLSNEVLPPTVLPSLDPLLAQVPKRPRSSVLSWVSAPILSVNQAFDRATIYLGSAGSWLRSQRGRALLGYAGIGMMLGAASWMVRDWLGWN